MPLRAQTAAAAVAVVAALFSIVATNSGCATAVVHARPDLGDYPEQITGIVALPTRLGFGKLAEQRRAGRRVSDFLIQATGGRAILADELAGSDPELIASGLKDLGEDPKRTLTFSLAAARDHRSEAAELPGRGSRRTIIQYADYTVRLDVRNAEDNSMVGSIETYASAHANAPETDSKGRALGLAQAAEVAIEEAIRRFAPRLVQPAGAAPFGTWIEIPKRRGGGGNDSRASEGAKVSDSDSLRRLQTLYPEVNETDLRNLVSSRARLLIVRPGRLAAIGIEPGDLVSGIGAGRQSMTRAALARALARGETPALRVDRAAQRFLFGRPVAANGNAAAAAASPSSAAVRVAACALDEALARTTPSVWGR